MTTIQRPLGHHDLRTTQRYAHVMDKTAQQQYHTATPALALSRDPVRLRAAGSGTRRRGASVARIEQALSLAPVPLATLTGSSPPNPLLAVPAAVTKEALDNSM